MASLSRWALRLKTGKQGGSENRWIEQTGQRSGVSFFHRWVGQLLTGGDTEAIFLGFRAHQSFSFTPDLKDWEAGLGRQPFQELLPG